MLLVEDMMIIFADKSEDMHRSPVSAVVEEWEW
jgi:hypothetical protein